MDKIPAHITTSLCCQLLSWSPIFAGSKKARFIWVTMRATVVWGQPKTATTRLHDALGSRFAPRHWWSGIWPFTIYRLLPKIWQRPYNKWRMNWHGYSRFHKEYDNYRFGHVKGVLSRHNRSPQFGQKVLLPHFYFFSRRSSSCSRNTCSTIVCLLLIESSSRRILSIIICFVPSQNHHRLAALENAVQALHGASAQLIKQNPWK